MSETVKHTKGPWRVGAPPDKVCTNYGGGDDVTRNGWGKTIVTCKRSSWMGEGEEFANARLIAAAPELLQSLKNMVEAFNAHSLGGDMDADQIFACRSAIENADAAIIQAEGMK